VTPIAKNVIVTDEAGNFYEPTYPKRAQGLIKNGRARAIGENKICLTKPIDNRADAPRPPLHERNGYTMNEQPNDKHSELAYVKAKLDSFKIDFASEEMRFVAQQDYAKLVSQYMRLLESTKRQKHKATKRVSMDTSQGYDFDDMPGMPNFIKQLINKGYFNPINNPMMMDYIKDWQQGGVYHKSNDNDDDEDVCNVCGHERDDCECCEMCGLSEDECECEDEDDED